MPACICNNTDIKSYRISVMHQASDSIALLRKSIALP